MTARTVLNAMCVEINEEGISTGIHYTLESSDAQRWYIEYLHGQSNESFLIVSNLNGKALYCKGGDDGKLVKTLEKRRLLHYLKKIFQKQPETHQLYFIDIDDDSFSTCQ